MKQVTVLEGNGECSTKVSGSISTLWLDRDGRRLVHAQVDVAVKHGFVFMLVEVDTGIAHNTQATKVVVGVTQVTSRIDTSFSEEGVTLHNLLTQRNNRIVRITAEVVDVPNRIDFMRSGRRLGILIGMQHQCEVYLVSPLNGVSTIGDEVLVETVVAAIDKILCNARALTIQIVGIEHHPFLQHATGRVYLVKQTSNGGILNIIVHTAQEVRHTRMQRVERAHLLTFLLNGYVGRASQVPQVLHLCLQRLQRLQG